MTPEGEPGPESGPRAERLESWKEIAAYFGRGVSTVQRWEKEEGLPVHRHGHARLGSVYAFKSELDAWRANRPSAPAYGEQARAEEPVRRGPRVKRVWLFAGLFALLLITLIPASRILRHTHAGAPRVVPLTSFPGIESAPSFSPDGTQVVFAWNGESGKNFDLYRMPASGGTPVRLTSDPRDELFPKWSPDGRWIAFLRPSARSLEAFVIPSTGGAERRVAEVGRIIGLQNEMEHLAWSPDGKALVLADRHSEQPTLSLFLIPLDASERRRLTHPPDGIPGDLQGAFSPNGKWLAFVRYTSGSEADVYITPAQGGAARRLTNDECYIRGLDWLPDSRGLVFSSGRTGGGYALWRIAASGGAPVPLIRVGPGRATLPAISRRGRLAYEFELLDVNIWRWDNPGRRGSAPAPVARSTRTEVSPAFSPDGTKIAFSSNRSREFEIWVSNADGSNPVQWTHMSGPFTDSPRWSPDGQSIAFTSHSKGNRDIYVVTAAGAVRRLTSEQSEEGRASWSRDGRWIYFRSDRSGAQQIWKTPADGKGGAVQVTRSGAYEAFESPDGSLLYFVKDRAHPGLWSTPVAGGQERLLTGSVREGLWAVAEGGIYFLDAAGAKSGEGTPLDLYRFDTGQVERIATLAGKLWSGFSVRPDGGSILWVQEDLHTSDLMLMDPLPTAQ